MTIACATAQSYHKAGLSVLPAIRAQKRPSIGSWKIWSQRLPNEIEVEAWFSNNCDAMCIVAGRVSGNLECIDFDCGGEAYPKWAAKIPPHILAQLIVESTPSGGKHVVYRCESEVEGNQKLAQAMRGEKLTTLIETRAEGGLFLCAPSVGYSLEQGRFTKIPTLDTDVRERLLTAARELNEYTDAKLAPTRVNAPTGGFVTRPGDDFAQRGDIRAILLAHGWTQGITRPDGNELWTRPGKDTRKGHSASIKDRVFYVFSSNAAPFEANHGYNAFQVYTILEHNGDFTAATNALLDRGYGTAEDFSNVDTSFIEKELASCEPMYVQEESKEECEEIEDFPRYDLSGDPGPIPERLYEVPGFIGELMQHTMRTAPYPNPAMAFAGAFAALAHLSGQKYTDDLSTRPNVYIIALAASGSGKQHPRTVNNNLSTEMAFAGQMADTFASGEGLEDSLLISPCMFYQVDEIDTLFNMFKLGDVRAEMINSTLLRFYSESAGVHIMRKKALQRDSNTTSHIDQPHLTFLGTAVPKYFYASLNERVMSNGLLARCLVIEAGSRGKSNRDQRVEPFPDSVIDDVKTLIKIGHEITFYDQTPQPRIVPMAVGVRDAIFAVRDEADQLYQKFEQLDNDCALALWARAAEKVSKFALIRAISRNVANPIISIEDVSWARDIIFHATWRMLYQTGMYVYEGEFDRIMKRVMQRITRKKGRQSYRDILRNVSIGKDELDRILTTLVARGELKVEKGTRGGDIFVATGK